jgi:hypothetical protein
MSIRITASALAALTLTAGCIKAPMVTIVDRKTALEEQAAGTYKPLDAELDQASVSAKPVPYTRGQLESGGVPVGKGDEELAQADAATDADLIDQLLTRRCVGESLDGTIVDTPKTCTEPLAPAQQARLLESENRRRWQIWRSLLALKSTSGRQPSVDELRKTWRAVHLGEVICGGQVETATGWEIKKC